MRIAVNACFLISDKLEGYGYFVQEIFSRLALQFPEHEFIFVFDRPWDPQFIFSSNITPVLVTPKSRHALSFKFWYDIKLPLALRKYKPDIIVQPYGFCSLTTRIPQILVIHDLAFLHFPQFIPRHHLYYYKAFTSKFIRKARKVLTVSEFSKKDIISQYHTKPEKIDVVYSASKSVFKALDFTEQQLVKLKYTEGRDFFLFTGGIHPRKNVYHLLKAFSLFKKWQKSNMKLVIVGRLAWQYEDLLLKLESYKYRADVLLLNYLDETELARLTASAYAMVFPSYFEGFGVPLVESMQSGIPVIAGNAGSLPEIGGDAALYADPFDPDSIAKQMLRLYKDETLRAELVKKGFQNAARFSWERTAGLLWQGIVEICGERNN